MNVIEYITIMEFCQNNVHVAYNNDSNKARTNKFFTDEHDPIYIKTGEGREILTKQMLANYISTICEKMKITSLSSVKVCKNVYPKLKHENSMKDIDEQIISSTSEMALDHYDYPCIAVWILINNLHENTHVDYINVLKQLRQNKNSDGSSAPIINDDLYKFAKKHREEINKAFHYERDFDISVFGYRTLEKSYLKKINIDGVSKIVERPQHLYMRVAIALHYRTNRIDRILETYELLSNGFFTHATPTLFNAGTLFEQLSSCFLLGMTDDLENIGQTIARSLLISKYSGGIGIHATKIRSSGSYIKSTQGYANGLKFIPIFNSAARYADQGGKRPGSVAFYIEPWHPDIEYFLDLKKTIGPETERARDLFFGLMVNNIFMKRVESDGVWSLFDPSKCPDLADKYGKDFDDYYTKLENKHMYTRQISARKLWNKIMYSIIETGVPYIAFKDHVNEKTNQKNIGTIGGLNLCAEIAQVSSSDEYAVCFPGKTEIMTINGIKKIKDCDDEYIYSFFNNDIDLVKNQHFEKAKLVKNGTKIVYELCTMNSKSIEATADHPFFVKSTDSNGRTTLSWKKLSEIKIGDYLYSPRNSIIKKFRIDKTKIDYTNDKIETKSDIVYDTPMNQAKYLSLLFRYGKHTVIENTSCVCLTIKNDVDYDKVQTMLRNFGIGSKVFHNYENINGTSDFIDQIDDNILISTIVIYRPIDIINYYKYIHLDFSLQDDTVIRNIDEKYFNDYEVVIDINCVGEKQVYDLCLPDSHNFVANGYVVHNCNLASICLPKFILFDSNNQPYFDYDKLYQVTRTVCRNLNNVIDINYYPVEQTKTSNLRHRPIGIGVQGLADLFNIFKVPFASDKAKELNKNIFETIYFAALSESVQIAKENGHYETFPGSPLSEGKFQFNLWNFDESKLSGMWDWEQLRKDILQHGVSNSLVTTCMPTASTSQIMNNNECIEPYTENIYTRSTTAGDYYVVNKHLMKDLIELGLWKKDIVTLIKYYQGSISNIPMIPDNIKSVYKTSWEIPQRHIIDLAVDRAPFIDQTQSMNLFIANGDSKVLNSCLFHGWKNGLKTGIYYLRTKPKTEANKFGIDICELRKIQEKYNIEPIPDDDNFSIPQQSDKPQVCVAKIDPVTKRRMPCENGMCHS